MASMRDLMNIAAGELDHAERPMNLLPERRSSCAGMLTERVEAQTYATLLNENARADFLYKTYGAKLNAKWEVEGAGEPADVADEVAAADGVDAAQKVIAYLVSCDPSPNHQFVQWLCVRYLKGGFRLEDREAALENLEVFARPAVKVRLAQKDINGYPTMADVRAAVEPFVTDANAMMAVKSSDNDSLEQRMRKPDQINMLHDAPDLQVLVPLTREAATYWGRNTEWCTAWGGPMSRHPDRSNRFASYNTSGPLFIVTMKPEGTLYQLHFADGQFADVEDRMQPLRSIVDQRPALVGIIGPKYFSRYVKELGLKYYSPEDIANLDPNDLAKGIMTQEDLALVSEPVKASLQFQIALLHRGRYEKVDASDRISSPYYLTLLPKTYWQKNIDALLEQNFSFFSAIPAKEQTQERADHIADEIGNHHALKNTIPKRLFSVSVSARYWALRGSQDANLRLGDVPEEYRTERLIFRCLRHHLPDIATYSTLLTPAMVGEICGNAQEAFDYIPPDMFNDELAAKLNAFAVNDAKAHQYRSYGSAFKFFKRFDPKFWTADAVKFFLKEGDKDFKFQMLPERLMTPEITTLYLKKYPAQVSQVPEARVTPDVIKAVLKDAYGADVFKAFLSKINPSLVDGELLAAAVKAHSYPNQMRQGIPKSMLTKPVVQALVDKGSMPLSKIPPSMLTDAAIVARTSQRNYGSDMEVELSGLPKARLTSSLAVDLMKSSHGLLSCFPDNVLNSAVLEAWLATGAGVSRSYHYNDKAGEAEAVEQYQRFPQSAWTSNSCASAVALNLLPPSVDAIPAALLNGAVAEAILTKAPAEIARMPSTALSENVLVDSVRKSWSLLDELTPEQLTEPVLFAAFENFAQHAQPRHEHRGTYSKRKPGTLFATLTGLPRENFSSRIYEAGVGYTFSIKEVPRKFRSNALIRTAIERDPSEAAFVKDLPAWMNANMADHQSNKDALAWNATLENLGVFKTKKGWVSTAGLERQSLDDGFTYSVLSTGTTNKRAYLFDPAGKGVLSIYTDKGGLHVVADDGRGGASADTKKNLKLYKKQILELLREPWANGFDPFDFNEIGIYSIHGHIVSEDAISRKMYDGLEWSSVMHKASTKHTAWIAGKPIVSLYNTTGSGGWGRSSESTSCTVFDMPRCILNSGKIAAYLSKKHIGMDHSFSKLGIIDSNGLTSIAQTRIGRAGDLAVWRGGDIVGLFSSKEGLIATGKVRKNLSISGINVPYSKFHSLKEKLGKVFELVSAYLVRSAAGKVKPFELGSDMSREELVPPERDY